MVSKLPSGKQEKIIQNSILNAKYASVLLMYYTWPL